MVLPKTCDYCRWERGRRVLATVNTGKDYVDFDGHQANPLDALRGLRRSGPPDGAPVREKPATSD